MRNFYKYAMKKINLLGSLVLILFLYNSSMADAKIGTFGEGSFGFEYNTETREAIVIGLFYAPKPNFTTDRVLKIPSTIKLDQITYTVKSIGAKAFLDCDSLGAIVLPPTIESIGDSAFMGCENLKSIEIPNSVKKLGVASFLACRRLVKLELPDDITYIPKSCLSLCTGLEELHLPSKLEKVGYEGVAYCISLKKLELPSSLKEIEEYGFTNSRNIKSLRIPNSLRVIPHGCFKNCDSLQVIEIPSSVEEIAEYAFTNNLSLKEIHLSEGLKKIGYGAFGVSGNPSSYNITHLQKVNIPASVIDMREPFVVYNYEKNYNRVSEINYLGSYSDYQKSKGNISNSDRLYVPENQYYIFRENNVQFARSIWSFDKVIKSTAAYGTICVPRTGAYVSDINKLYTIASIEGQYIKLKEVEMTPIGYRLEAGMPYIYEKKTNANSISICYLNEEVETPLIDHAFFGTFKDIYAPKGSYVLQSDGKFHIVDADNKIKVAANHCYFNFSWSGHGIVTYSLDFGGETTGVTGLKQSVEKNNSPIYDLSGRRVSTLSNGVYIQNGKKFVVK